MGYYSTQYGLSNTSFASTAICTIGSLPFCVIYRSPHTSDIPYMPLLLYSYLITTLARLEPPVSRIHLLRTDRAHIHVFIPALHHLYSDNTSASTASRMYAKDLDSNMTKRSSFNVVGGEDNDDRFDTSDPSAIGSLYMHVRRRRSSPPPLTI